MTVIFTAHCFYISYTFDCLLNKPFPFPTQKGRHHVQQYHRHSVERLCRHAHRSVRSLSLNLSNDMLQTLLKIWYILRIFYYFKYYIHEIVYKIYLNVIIFYFRPVCYLQNSSTDVCCSLANTTLPTCRSTIARSCLPTVGRPKCPIESSIPIQRNATISPRARTEKCWRRFTVSCDRRRS